MKKLLACALGFGAAYVLVAKLAPVVYTKIESMNLDSAWDVFDEEWGDLWRKDS